MQLLASGGILSDASSAPPAAVGALFRPRNGSTLKWGKQQKNLSSQ